MDDLMDHRTPLFPVLPIEQDETTPSFVSRLAAANFATPREFCTDMGMYWPHLCTGYDDQVAQLSWVSGIPVQQLALQSAPCTSRSRYSVRFAKASAGVFRRASTRICPKCMVQAIEQNGKHGAFQKLDWLLMSIHSCEEHACPLLLLPDACHTHDTYDVVSQVHRHWRLIKVAAESPVKLDMTGYERFVRERIQGIQTDHWLSRLDLSDLHGACLNLGSALEFGTQRLISQLTDVERQVAAQRGFEVLDDEASGLSEAMDHLKENHVSRRPYISSDLGSFYLWLRKTMNVSELEPLRHRVVDEISKRYPVRQGQLILKNEITEQKRTTSEYARKFTNFDMPRIKATLVHLGRFTQQEVKKITEFGFDELDLAREFWDDHLNVKEAASMLGVYPTQIRTFVEEAVLPSTQFESSRIYIPKSPIEKILNRLAEVPVDKPNRFLLPIKIYCRNYKVAYAHVVSQLMEGTLQDVARLDGELHLDNLLVHSDFKMSTRKELPGGDLTLLETAAFLKTKVRTVRILRDNGYLKQIARISPKTNREKFYITRRSIDEFQLHHVTLGQMSLQTEVASIHLARRLDRDGVSPIDTKGGSVRVY